MFSIENPCAGTSPLVQSFTNALTAARLETDSLDLSSEFTPWPFLDTIDQDSSYALVNTQKCGLTEYMITEFADGSDTTPAYIDLTGTTLTFSPTLTEPVDDIKTLFLKVSMVDYPDRKIYVPFQVKPTDCRATIDASLASITDKFVAWGADAQDFNETPAFAAFSFSPACPYTISYEVKQLVSGNVVPLPSEVTFNPATKTFTVEKCSDASAPGDASCNQVWSDTTYTIVVVASTENGSSNSEVQFDVTIFNDCAADTISMLDIADFTIFGYENLPDTPIQAQYTQDNPACPVTCAI